MEANILFRLILQNVEWRLTVTVIRRKEAKITSIGVTPAGILNIVTVTIIGSVLAWLAREINFQRALVCQYRVSDVHRGQGERDLLFS